MSLGKLVVYNGMLQQQINQGDVPALAEVIPTTNATNAITVTAAMLAQTFMQRTTTGAGTSTIDTAANIIAILGTIQPGTTWRLRWIQNAAFADTLVATANTGVSGSNLVVNASSVKDFLVTVINGTPAQTFPGITVNASPIVTGFTAAQLALLSPGMVVTNAVAGLQGLFILGININAGSVTMSGNATADNPVATNITFSPRISVAGIGQSLL